MATLLRTAKDGPLWRVYDTRRARRSALTQLVHRGGYNYFVQYQDVHGFALTASYADWVAPDAVHVDW